MANCRVLPLLFYLASLALPAAAAGEAAPTLERDVLPLLRARCVKCHGPAKQEAQLDLSTLRGLAAGGENGPAVDRAAPLESLIWQRVGSGEMPPDRPLPEMERKTLETWLAQGAAGLPAAAGADPAEHWAFRPLIAPPPPDVAKQGETRTAVDRYLLAALEAKGLTFSPEADRYALTRRLSFDLTGLPPAPEEIEQFIADERPDAYERLVERYLASPHYGERWGKWWLDAAGYADSNGYFSADSDRPLAYRYRDYVVAALNRDQPFDQFIREQLAGDELSGHRAGGDILPEQVGPLVATHFLRNAQDGTGESDGNPDEVRADRYSVLEGTQQIIGSALLGLTLQCARCHDHKFEPVTQAEYYQLQAILAGAFDPEHWVKPNERQIVTASAAEIAAWEAQMRAIDERVARLRSDFAAWVREHRPRGQVIFEDHFDVPDQLAQRWSNTAPGDDAPGGSPAVQVGAASAPAALAQDGCLRILESGGGGNRWLSTRESFDWTPDEIGASIEATFDLVADKIAADAPAAARIGYYLSLHDYDDNAGPPGGNVLIDGNPSGGAEVHVDYPGADSRPVGAIGNGKYAPGRNYGVRITNRGEDLFQVEHLVDGIAEEKSAMLKAADLAAGGFGFEFCCGRSFIVDNVLIEASPPQSSEPAAEYAKIYTQKRQELESAVSEWNKRRTERPGRTSVVVDVSPTPPDWFLLVRGNYGQRGTKVEPGVPAVLSEPSNFFTTTAEAGATTSGRRRALAQWLTRPGSRSAALLARVTVNRVWQHHFGVGLCATPDNLGLSGSPPSHPELLEHLAHEFVRSGWSLKSLHRAIVLSTAYRQTSQPREDALRVDADNRLAWRWPLRRLDAESLRDAALAASGELDRTIAGRYVPTDRTAAGEVVVDESKPGGRRRSLYLQQRRTQTLSVLEVFDAPSIVSNCTRRSSSTIPLQSLSTLNSDFAVARARGLAERLARESNGEIVRRAFLLVVGRPPRDDEQAAAERFLWTQPGHYADRPDAERQALVDFCQMLLASNAFLYLE